MGERAGQFRRHRVTIQTTTSTTTNAVGQREKTWGGGVERWAFVEDLSGRTLFVAQAAGSRATVQVTLRGPVDVAPLTHRILFGARVLHPRHVSRDPGGRVVRVLCEEAVGVEAG